MEKKSIFQPGEKPFGGSNGQFVIAIKKIYYLTSTKKDTKEFDTYSLIKLMDGVVSECERIIYNCDRKTAYSHLTSTYNAIISEASNILNWRHGLEINKEERIKNLLENSDIEPIIKTAWEICESAKEYLLGQIIDHFPEKLKNSELIEAARSLPNFNQHRHIAERYAENIKTPSKSNNIEDFKLIFCALKNADQIHHNANEKIFINICLGIDIKQSDRIKWKGSRKNCFAFMMDLKNDKIKEGEINKVFEQWNERAGVLNKQNLRANDKTGVKSKDYIKNLLKKFKNE